MANPQAHHSKVSFSISLSPKISVTLQFDAGSVTMRKVGCVGEQLIGMEIVKVHGIKSMCFALFVSKFVSKRSYRKHDEDGNVWLSLHNHAQVRPPRLLCQSAHSTGKSPQSCT